mmetsp:Transcript_30808/g.98371  ORF Transcript_30808/g.98371 Transcript_30808/m.98371 type:complete len:210 (+) Transcript_30808:120-749(+)
MPFALCPISSYILYPSYYPSQAFDNTPGAMFGTLESSLDDDGPPSNDTLKGRLANGKPRALRTDHSASHVVEGSIKGAQEVAGGVYDGVSSMIAEPIDAFNKEPHPMAKPGQAAKGLVKGVASLICKPAAGTCAAIATGTRGLINTPTTVTAAAARGIKGGARAIRGGLKRFAEDGEEMMGAEGAAPEEESAAIEAVGRSTDASKVPKK